jgi:hypothetical protein
MFCPGSVGLSRVRARTLDACSVPHTILFSLRTPGDAGKGALLALAWSPAILTILDDSNDSAQGLTIWRECGIRCLSSQSAISRANVSQAPVPD